MGGLLGERFGRRPVYILMLLICEIGTIISYFAKNFAQILAGRMLNQMYIGMEGWLVPMFHAEIIPAPIRGAVVVGYVFNHIFGSFIMSCITFQDFTMGYRPLLANPRGGYVHPSYHCSGAVLVCSRVASVASA